MWFLGRVELAPFGADGDPVGRGMWDFRRVEGGSDGHGFAAVAGHEDEPAGGHLGFMGGSDRVEHPVIGYGGTHTEYIRDHTSSRKRGKAGRGAPR
ncbi:hypothetical protein ACGFNQ_21400 [Streptomyces asoensis]|uniref:hypothetical protein n=1 Tax=Streptomyces asoensis TaxID=249586 RepID=UPI0037187159